MILETRVKSKNNIPTRANPTDAGLDLRANTSAFIGKSRVMVGTGVSVKIPVGYVGLLVARSSLSKKDLVLSNSIGIIDSDYRGELKVALTYIGSGLGENIEEGDRIAQLLVVPIALPLVNLNMDTEEEWCDTDRGAGGFGSTGVK